MQVVNKPTLGKHLDKPHAGEAMSQPTQTTHVTTGASIGCAKTPNERVIMATAGERINALESNIAAMMQLMQSMAGNAPAADDADNITDDVVTTADAPKRNGRTTAAKPATKPAGRGGRTGRSNAGTTEAATKPEKDRSARCTINQAQYAAYIARAFTGIVPRQSKQTGARYYAGVKRETFTPAKEKAYNAHVENAIRELLAAFNIYADDDAVDVKEASYGDLWDWLNENAPVSASKAAASK